MTTTLELYPPWRDTWGSFDPVALAQLRPLAGDECYQPKFYKAPDDDQEILPAGGYLEYGMLITPGSLIWGFSHPPATGNFAGPGFVMQITNMDLGIDLFSEPVPDWFLSNNTQPGPFPWLMSSACPSVGKGLFRFQFWNNSGASLRCNMIVNVAEVVQCKY